MIHYFCGTCGASYLAVYDRQSKTVRAEPDATCAVRHPLCIQIGTAEEARLKREGYPSTQDRSAE